MLSDRRRALRGGIGCRSGGLDAWGRRHQYYVAPMDRRRFSVETTAVVRRRPEGELNLPA